MIKDVSVLVYVPAIAGEIVPGIDLEIRFQETLVPARGSGGFPEEAAV
jgi:hypothetical protein